MLRLIRSAFLNEFLLISLGAYLSFLQVSYIVAGTEQSHLLPAALAGMLTLAFYQTHKWVNYYWEKWKKLEGHDAKPTLWIIILVYSSTLTLTWIFAKRYPPGDLLFLLPAFVLGGLYVIPAFRNQLRLRDLRIVKIFIIAFTWAWVTGVWPAWLLLADIKENWLLISGLGVERLTFIFALTVPFDIRDIHLDKIQGRTTLPILYGLERSKGFAYLSLALHSIFLTGLLVIHTDLPIPALFGLYLIVIIAALLVKNSTPLKPDYYFSGLLDGCIILEALFLILSLG